MTTIARLTGYAVEFFWGEAVYEATDQLRRLRKWRLITMSLPIIGLVMSLGCAIAWPQSRVSVETLRKRLELTMESDINRLEYRIESVNQAMGSLQVGISAINGKLDLIVWLAAGVFLSQVFSNFYQFRFRRAMKDIDR